MLEIHKIYGRGCRRIYRLCGQADKSLRDKFSTLKIQNLENG